MKLWQIHKHNRKNYINLEFIFCARLERNLLFRFEPSSLVTLSKHWLELAFSFFYYKKTFITKNFEKKKKKKKKGFPFSIKWIKPLKNGETRNKAIVKFWWWKFENHILTKSAFCYNCLHHIEQDLLCLLVKTKGFQLFSLLRRISDFTSWS